MTTKRSAWVIPIKDIISRDIFKNGACVRLLFSLILSLVARDCKSTLYDMTEFLGV